MKIPLAKPYLDKAEEKAVVNVIRSGWVTQGPKVIEMEEQFKVLTEKKFAIATSSATTALFLALYILDIGPGDEVLVPSFTFIATANVIVHTGAKPIFIDIDPRTYNMDSKEIEKRITKKTKAIMPVDQVGLPCDMITIVKIAKKHKLFIVEDAACAIGSRYKGKSVGSLADITCFSFHPRKVVTTGDGGMLVTNNKKWADRARILRQQGMGTSDLVRSKSNQIIHESYPEIGFNFRMTDIQAAVGVEQMKKLPKLLQQRKILAERYTKSFFKTDLIIPPYVPDGMEPNWQSYIVRLKKNSKISRDEFMQKLLNVGVATRRGIMSIHKEVPYIKKFGKVNLPLSVQATDQTISLPIYPQMTKSEQDYVISNILSIIN